MTDTPTPPNNLPAATASRPAALVELAHDQLPELYDGGEAYPWEPYELSTPSLVRLVNHLEQAVELATSSRAMAQAEESADRNRALSFFSVSNLVSLAAAGGVIWSLLKQPFPLDPWGNTGILLVFAAVFLAMSVLLPWVSEHRANEKNAEIRAHREREFTLRGVLAAYRSELALRQGKGDD